MKPIPGIIALRAAIVAGEAGAEAALRTAFNRAHAAQPRLEAFSHLPAELEFADIAASAPLAGVAVAVKDMMDTADMPTTYGSPIHRGHYPARDAWVVRRLRALGAHVLGKSVTTEFAWRHPGTTANPWNTAHTPGGSSSGSAAAVGAGIVPLALGTQTLGSVIRPAAYCGVVGYKPTYGAISRAGVCPLAETLDHVGLFTRGVDDAAYALHLLAGQDEEDPHGTPLPPFGMEAFGAPAPAPRIGLLQTTLLGEVDACQAALLAAVARRLEQAGAGLAPVRLPADFAGAHDLTVAIAAVEAARIHAQRMREFPQLISAPLTALIEQGRGIGADAYAALLARRRALQEAYAAWKLKAGIDVLLMPPATGEAPAGLGFTGDARFCSPLTVIGVPAITLPAGFGPNGLPLGVQLAGGSGEDLALLRAARWCETVIAHPPRVPDWLAN